MALRRCGRAATRAAEPPGEIAAACHSRSSPIHTTRSEEACPCPNSHGLDGRRCLRGVSRWWPWTRPRRRRRGRQGTAASSSPAASTMATIARSFAGEQLAELSNARPFELWPRRPSYPMATTRALGQVGARGACCGAHLRDSRAGRLVEVSSLEPIRSQASSRLHPAARADQREHRRTARARHSGVRAPVLDQRARIRVLVTPSSAAAMWWSRGARGPRVVRVLHAAAPPSRASLPTRRA